MELLLAVFAAWIGLLVFGFWLRKQAVYVRIVYGGTPVWRSGPQGSLEVLALRAGSRGPLVGIGFNVLDAIKALSVSPEDAQRLAELVEQAADELEAQQRLAR